MNDTTEAWMREPERPALPLPTRSRWQPLRIGLVELFHYDSEEFWFRDGHLLLRGNNGTGKSKVLSLTLPFLLDAQLKASRIEPDGDAGKKMAWNLLLGSYERRIGYAWIEFGRIAEDGTPHYLTLGAGLSAAAARAQVDSWFFVLDGARINQELWLTNEQRTVLGKERLRDALEGRGQVFDTAAAYRRAVDERLFRLGTTRYEALMDTLIQLRQPQLSKKPDEAALSHALTEALPPLAIELLGDVAEALNRLEEDRRQLDEYQALAKAVERFERRYRVYAGASSRRQARALRQAQSEFDGASRARSDAQARLRAAEQQEALAGSERDAAELALARQRARVDTLLADPAMQDANRLEGAAREAAAREQASQAARAALAEFSQRLARAAEEVQQHQARVEQAERARAEARRHASECADVAGFASPFAANALAALPGEALAALAPRAFDAAAAALRALLTQRREQIALLRRRHAELAQAEALRQQRLMARDERHDAVEAAALRREQADAGIEREGQALQRGWERHLAGLQQLQVDAEAVLAALADWVVSLQGDNPAQQALQQAQAQANVRLAALRVGLLAQRDALDSERQLLLDEQHRLEAGVDAAPPLPYTRAADVRHGRAGAPLWQLLDFCDAVQPAQRAGLEAALEASGLLDAWVAPSGQVQDAQGATLLDSRALARAPRQASLARWLRAGVAPDSAVSAEAVEQLLAGVACGDDDPADAESWIAPDGRFRLGALAGAWNKPAAAYIGHAARAAARAKRLTEIATRLNSLLDESAALHQHIEAQAQHEQRAAAEWHEAPRDQALRQAQWVAAQCERDYQLARERLAQADEQLRAAEQAAQAVRQGLAQDAADLRLPEAADALAPITTALDGFDEAQRDLQQAARELRLALPAWQRQREREAEAAADVRQREEQFAASRIEAEEARSRLQVLREAVGAKVGELQQQLAAARGELHAGENLLKATHKALNEAGVARGAAAQKATDAETDLQQRSDARAQAVTRLQQFAATGLLLAALPQLDLPELAAAWTIDPALTLARRAEQLLSGVDDDDAAWARVQRQITEELTELQRALGALGHQAPAETSDFGLIVHIVYQNRPERPDRLAARLADEIAQRSELLSAHEREVLENHLQAEIAAEVQRLLHAAQRQVDAINKELHKRPTSTGVRFRLLWLPLGEDEGAPVGLQAARKRLLNTRADLWSAEDRRIVGAMLQQRIAAERERADLGLGKDGGGSLLEQLASELDYRHWHRFRVERWQDGQWRRLSGPASSGERALGLTVPLFAAVASFYSQGSHALAPRLMLLDEAFAGIDDAARAHCMGLIREFDLDFVITSEREWACYAELPGVAICQLQRREGIDAVFVSRWSWDGKAKQREADPDRRFAPA